ncbi:arsenate reductase (glutaredoxin) [Sphingomonas sp. So64.6b]|uniref:arsenate reductase (glutaredoxin) n=1 Tax=Sphingomonas sp. So64.6b TaxID=2997354 RepID=UPI0016013FD2|nr:arsenate reductase (glutaredoxin) [Sphingomonas sp. So64.6b]QNA85246.1 arsenate reductase (glutaredoxin) [Sphingomonas sp. So64.6b]
MTDFPVTIYHNPDCGTSRNVLAMIEAAGYAPTVIDYRQTGWTREQLERLFAAIGLPARAMLRDKGTPAAELRLGDPALSDAALIDAMVAHPILVNRPIVATPRGTKLCRPSETVLPLLDRQPDRPDRPDRFVKEDGEIVLP